MAKVECPHVSRYSLTGCETLLASKTKATLPRFFAFSTLVFSLPASQSAEHHWWESLDNPDRNIYQILCSDCGGASCKPRACCNSIVRLDLRRDGRPSHAGAGGSLRGERECGESPRQKKRKKRRHRESSCHSASQNRKNKHSDSADSEAASLQTLFLSLFFFEYSVLSPLPIDVSCPCRPYRSTCCCLY